MTTETISPVFVTIPLELAQKAKLVFLKSLNFEDAAEIIGHINLALGKENSKNPK